MTIQCTIQFENMGELVTFAKLWDEAPKSNPAPVAQLEPEPKPGLRGGKKAKSKVDPVAEKPADPVAEKPADPVAEKPAEVANTAPAYEVNPDPAAKPICTPDEFVTAVRNWHQKDPIGRTSLIQKEMKVLGEEKLQAIHPKYYPEFLAELGISI